MSTFFPSEALSRRWPSYPPRAVTRLQPGAGGGPRIKVARPRSAGVIETGSGKTLLWDRSSPGAALDLVTATGKGSRQSGLAGAGAERLVIAPTANWPNQVRRARLVVCAHAAQLRGIHGRQRHSARSQDSARGADLVVGTPGRLVDL